MNSAAPSRFLVLLSSLKEPGRARIALAAALYAGAVLLMFLGVHYPIGGGHPTGMGPLLAGAWSAVLPFLSYPGDWFTENNALFWIWIAWLGAYAFLVHALMRSPVRRFLPLALVAGLAALPLLITPVIQTVDPWEYLIRARMLVLHGYNPYVVLPRTIPTDPLYSMTVWHDVNFVYGPVWLAFVSMLVLLPGIQMVQLTALKAMMLVFQIGAAAVLWELKENSTAAGRVRDTALLLFSPMMIFESAGNGHADFAMIFLLLLAVLLDRRGLPLLAATCLACAALVKAYAALALICYAFALMNRYRGPGLWRDLLRTFWPAAALIVFSYGLFYNGGGFFPSVRGGGAESSTSDSFGAALTAWMPTHTVIRLGMLVTGLLTASAALFSWRTGRWVAAAAMGAFLWCTIGATWLMGWYPCFVLALALSTENSPLRDGALVFSALTFLFYVRNSSGWPFPDPVLSNSLSLMVPGWPLLTFGLMWRLSRRPAAGIRI